MIVEVAAQAGIFCNPFTSASCLGKVLTGAAAGFAIGDIPGAVIGAGVADTNVGGAVVGAVTNSTIGALANAVHGALSQIVTDTVAWWVKLPSPCLADVKGVTNCGTVDPVPAIIQKWLWPFTVTVALIGMITAGARMALTRKAAPLADVGGGLLAMAAVTALGTALPAVLLEAGDTFSTWVLNASTGGQFATRFADLVTMSVLVGGPNGAGLLIILGVIAVILAAIQAILLLFRMGAVIILAGSLPLAAAGQMAPLTRGWLRRQSSWMLALIFYKPAAALVYATGFVMFGNGTSAEDVLMGFAVLLLSLVALPVLMKFFTWTTGQAESGGGGLLGAIVGGAAAVGSMRGYGGSAAGQAGAVTTSLGSPGNGNGPGNGTSPGPGNGNGPGNGPPQGPAPGARTAPGGTTPTAARQPGNGASAPGSPGAGTSAGAGAPSGAGTPATAAAPAAGTAASSGAAGAGTAAGAAAGPVGMVVVNGGQALASGANGVANSAAPPPSGGWQ